jgi:hypothetical protein
MLHLFNRLTDRMTEREISNDVHSCRLFMICSFAALSSKNINISLVYSLIFSTYAFLHVWDRFIVFFFITLRLIFIRLRMREMIVIFTKTSNSSNKYFIIFFIYDHDFFFTKCFNATFIESVIDRERSSFLIERNVEMLNVFKLLRIFFITRLITSFKLAIDLRSLSTRKWWQCDYAAIQWAKKTFLRRRDAIADFFKNEQFWDKCDDEKSYLMRFKIILRHDYCWRFSSLKMRENDEIKIEMSKF